MKKRLILICVATFIIIGNPNAQNFKIFYSYESQSNINPDNSEIDTFIIQKSDTLLKRYSLKDKFFYISNMQHSIEYFYFYDNYDSSYLYYLVEDTVPKKYQYCNEAKNILGYLCNKAEVISETDTFIMYYTNKLNCVWSPIQGIDGFVLEVEVRSKMYKYSMFAYDINFDSTEEILFENNYRLITQNEYYETFQSRFQNIVDSLIEGQVAPSFSILDLSDKNVILNEKRGKVLVLNFWFIGCRGCVHEIPELNKLVEYFKDNKNVEFYAFTWDAKSSLYSFLQRKKFLFKIVPESSRIAKIYGVKGYPTTMIIDKNGKIGKTYYSRLIGDYDVKTDYVIKDIENLIEK